LFSLATVEKDLEFESPLDIVLYPDPRLRAKNAAIRKFDSKLEALCKEMFDVMYRWAGAARFPALHRLFRA
jgi:hypothetical protein